MARKLNNKYKAMSVNKIILIGNANKLPREANYFGTVDHIKIRARTIIELLNKENMK